MLPICTASKTLDFVVDGIEDISGKLPYICQRSEEIEAMITEKLGRGFHFIREHGGLWKEWRT